MPLRAGRTGIQRARDRTAPAPLLVGASAYRKVWLGRAPWFSRLHVEVVLCSVACLPPPLRCQIGVRVQLGLRAVSRLETKGTLNPSGVW